MKYFIFSLVLILNINSTFAAKKCKIKVRVHNRENVKIKLLGFEYKCGTDNWSEENVRSKVIGSGNIITTKKQKLNCFEGQHLTSLRAKYKKYTKHTSNRESGVVIHTRVKLQTLMLNVEVL